MALTPGLPVMAVARITAATQLLFVWKNDTGNATALTDGYQDAQAIAVFQGDVFVWVDEQKTMRKICGWVLENKRGSVSSPYAVRRQYTMKWLTELVVSGDDVFLVGTATNPDTRARKAKCWSVLTRVFDSSISPIYLLMRYPVAMTPMGF